MPDNSKPQLLHVKILVVPLEFVEDNKTGFILEANPEVIARKLDWLYYNKNDAKALGNNGLLVYRDKNISWDNVVQKLLED